MSEAKLSDKFPNFSLTQVCVLYELFPFIKGEMEYHFTLSFTKNNLNNALSLTKHNTCILTMFLVLVNSKLLT